LTAREREKGRELGVGRKEWKKGRKARDRTRTEKGREKRNKFTNKSLLFRRYYDRPTALVKFC
jgi:hypothetical protein